MIVGLTVAACSGRHKQPPEDAAPPYVQATYPIASIPSGEMLMWTIASDQVVWYDSAINGVFTAPIDNRGHRKLLAQPVLAGRLAVAGSHVCWVEEGQVSCALRDPEKTPSPRVNLPSSGFSIAGFAGAALVIEPHRIVHWYPGDAQPEAVVNEAGFAPMSQPVTNGEWIAWTESRSPSAFVRVVSLKSGADVARFPLRDANPELAIDARGLCWSEQYPEKAQYRVEPGDSAPRLIARIDGKLAGCRPDAAYLVTRAADPGAGTAIRIPFNGGPPTTVATIAEGACCSYRIDDTRLFVNKGERIVVFDLP